MVRQRSAERSDLIRERALLVQQALGHVGHPTIRNRGTVGGSVAHSDPAAGLPVVCVALDAELVARGVARERTIAAEDFTVGFMTTALAPDECCRGTHPRRRRDFSYGIPAICSTTSGDSAALATAAGLVTGELQPRSEGLASGDYRRRVAGVLTRRALAEAMA